jgi:hypothetical protein
VYQDKYDIIWNIKNKTCMVFYKLDSVMIPIPWFEPDFDDMKKLDNKIKTLMVFQ